MQPGSQVHEFTKGGKVLSLSWTKETNEAGADRNTDGYLEIKPEGVSILLGELFGGDVNIDG